MILLGSIAALFLGVLWFFALRRRRGSHDSW